VSWQGRGQKEERTFVKGLWCVCACSLPGISSMTISIWKLLSFPISYWHWATSVGIMWSLQQPTLCHTCLHSFSPLVQLVGPGAPVALEHCRTCLVVFLTHQVVTDLKPTLSHFQLTGTCSCLFCSRVMSPCDEYLQFSNFSAENFLACRKQFGCGA
jgi:hypothetical protein